MAGRRSFTVKGRIETEDASSKTVDKVEGRFKKFGSWLSSSFVITAGDVARAFSAVASALTSGIKAAVAQQRANTALAAAMKSAGTFSKTAAKSYDAQSVALEKATNVSRKTITELQSLALAFTSSNEEAAKLTAAALDFATGAGIAYEEALRRLGRAMQGSVDDLSKFVPGVRELTKEQLLAGKATELVATRFAGNAKQATQDLAGAYDNLKGAIGRATETMGTGIATSNEATHAMRALGDEIDRASPLWEKIGNATSRFVGSMITMTAEGVHLARTMAETYGWTSKVTDSTKAMGDAAESAAASVDKLSAAEERRRKIEAALKTQAEGVRAIFEELGVTLEKDVNVALKNNEQVMRELELAYRQQLISENDLINAKAALAASSRMLVDELHGETEELGDLAEAANTMADAANGAAGANREMMVQTMVTRTALRGQAAQVIMTSRAFDQLAASMGRAAAVSAALAGGGQLVLGGTRVNLPGGGSRLTHDARGSFDPNNPNYYRY